MKVLSIYLMVGFSVPAYCFSSLQIRECYDILGTRVQVMEIPGLGTAGATYTETGVPVIVHDPAFTARFGQATLDYIYLHECGHLKRGHVLQRMMGQPYTGAMEDEADLYATVKMGMLGYSRAQLDQVHADVSQFPGDVQHREGSTRQIVTQVGACAGRISEIVLRLLNH